MESDNHSRTIVFIELDEFFNKVDKLSDSAVGIHQKYLVLTNNYVSREYEMNNCVQVSEAMNVKFADDVVDMHDCVMLQNVGAVINKYTTCFENWCMNEYFIDVSKLVSNRLQAHLDVKAIGHIYGAEKCECGCVERLNMGSVIASEIRESIMTDLGLTCSAGIAHNKLLAKLAEAVNTPNQQTIVYPSCADQLLFSSRNLYTISAIRPYFRSLESLDIRTIKDLRICSMDTLKKTFGVDKAKTLMDFSYGKDQSPVFPNEQPLTTQDNCISFRSHMVEKNIRDQFLQLLHRLMNRVLIDGRIPRTIQVSLRKYDYQRKTSHKKQRSLNISPSLFMVAHTVNLTQYGQDQLMGIIMNLFHKLVDITIPYHVTILGLAFTKFQERLNAKNSVAALLMNNMSVQSVTSLQSGSESSRESLRMDYSPLSHQSLDVNTDGSESEIEPSPKKAKFDSLIAKRRCLDNSTECPSPSKLRVAELRLNSRELENNQCPDNVDSDVFKELPEDVQHELLQQWQIEKTNSFPPLKTPEHGLP